MTTTLAAAVLVSTMRLVASHGYAEGAPPGFSGGFKEDSCHACHFHEDVNAAPGSVTVDGVPASYVPGQRYTLTVTLTRADMKRAGFQLTARTQDGGAQAGALAAGAADTARVKVESQGGVQYAGQSLAGAAVEDGVARWTVEWTAPAGGSAAVVFHVSANAADGNESADGDFVYTASAESPAEKGPAPLSTFRDN